MKTESRMKTASVLTLGVLLVVLAIPPRALAWGAHGHTISGKAATMKLPPEMPKFFRKASDQLAYLNPEPDRWRDRAEAELNPTTRDAFNPDHFINFERFPAEALNAENRFLFLAELRKSGMETPEAGIVPYRILELFGRLRTEFRLWRTTTNKRERRFIEERIINDAGILGHYVTDGANPHHTTIHHHGWVGENPKGYATDREFHARFESIYVGKHITLANLTGSMTNRARVIQNPRAEVINYLRTSHGKVERLYELDKRAAYNELTTAPENKQFAVERLAAGAEMLRDLWWTAWVTSASPSS